MTEIYRMMTGISVPRPPALYHFIRNLAQQFQLGVFTLNYDDVVDGARDLWFDGFTRPVEQSQGGLYGQLTVSTRGILIFGARRQTLFWYISMGVFDLVIC
jgi:hypothetical protein